MFLQAVDRLRYAVFLEIGPRRAEDQSFAPEKTPTERRRQTRRPADPHGEIDALFCQIDEAVREQQVRPHVRILLGKAREYRHDTETPERGRQRDANGADRLALLRGEYGLRLRKLRQDARAGFIERTARVREHEPARRPLEQHDAEPPFEPGDTLAHR
jgi:hypothetical protein